MSEDGEKREVCSPEALEALVSATLAQGTRLSAMGGGRRGGALAAAASALADPSSPHGARARDLLPESTGLSREMIGWALETSLRSATAEEILALSTPTPPVARAQPVLPRLAALVLAGNVFTAAIQPIFHALALGVPVVCKASSRDDVLPRLLAGVLREIDPEVGSAYGVCSFPGGTLPLEDVLFERADVVVIYGSDRTVHTLRARVNPTTRLIEHGHGVSAAYLGAAAVSSIGEALGAAERLALDTAAYDQRGCFSPHVALVRRGGAVTGGDLLDLVHSALARVGERLPRGPLPADVGAAQMQWRGTMAVLGELREGPAHAVARVDEGGALRFGPGWRNLLILDCDGPEHAAELLIPLGVHLKAIGVAGDSNEVQRLAGALAPPLCPRLCPLGSMQAPGIDALADGAPALEGMVRWMSVDV